MMSDNLLLTSLWLVPLIGAAIVLALPRRSDIAVKWVSLAVTSVTFLISLVVLGVYLRGDPQKGARAPLRERAEHNRLIAVNGAEATTIDESGPAKKDLVVRRP
ncbi:MAG TPA: NADH-quinone oxidoreductase subunit M, partial [Isosphaeraceae bacterium]|nr:NADH-quinone oxidoreductase subunit M [Isosphaeraceae bacterium]